MGGDENLSWESCAGHPGILGCQFSALGQGVKNRSPPWARNKRWSWEQCLVSEVGWAVIGEIAFASTFPIWEAFGLVSHRHHASVCAG